MIDPLDALHSFQQALLDGRIHLQHGAVDPDLYFLFDAPNGEPRFTYVKLEGKTVTAFVEFVSWTPIESVPCFNIGYAVPEPYRNQDRAKEVIAAAITEMRTGLARAGIGTFYVEAIVGVENVASQHVARKAISPTAVETTDQISALPALQFIRKIEPEA